ncbi:MAG: hypothetical protein HYZ44_07055 [Bacteroidetes bacterium]|nr:hypothetical protein [Bacteroidota bacterium]
MREKLESWDIKSMIILILFFSISIGIYFYLTNLRDWWRNHESKEWKGATPGEIISVTPITRMSQSKWKGNEVVIDSYRVIYRYDVNGTSYQHTDVIPVTDTNALFIQRLTARKPAEVFIVSFNETDPEKSMLSNQ